MFRKNFWYSTLIATSLVTSLTSFARVERYMYDTWRDPVARGQVSDLYIGLQGAYVVSGWSDMADALEISGLGTTGTRAKFTDAKYAGRLFARWDFSRFFGIESGLSFVDGSETTFENLSVSPLVEIRDPEPGNPNLYKNKSSTFVVDASWVTRVPLQNSFTFYTKFGVDFMLVKSSFKFRVLNNGIGNKRFIFIGDDNSSLSITFGLGFNYQFSENWFGDLSYQHFRGKDNTRDFITDLNLYMVGVSYKISTSSCPKTCL